MADRTPDRPDLVVDELKRKARRRLVGAVVLALAAAIVLPMLLEKEPKPLGEDVAVRIPSIDDARFVSKLSGTDTTPAPGAPGAPAGGTPAAAETAPRADGPATTVEAAPKADAPAAERAKTKPESVPNAPAPAAAARAVEGYVVQLAAFADDKGANALAGRLKRGGYAAYVEPLQTSRGTLWRVRIGSFPSRAAADTVRDKLKAEGQSGIVVPVK